MSKLTPEQIAEMKGRLLIARDLARKDSDDAAVWMADAFLKVFAHIAAVEAERDAARAEAAKLRAALQVISTGGYNSLRTCAASIARSALTTPTQGAQP